VRPLILVLYHHGDRGAESVSELGARVDLDLVLLIAWGGECALAWSTARELRLDVGFS